MLGTACQVRSMQSPADMRNCTVQAEAARARTSLGLRPKESSCLFISAESNSFIIFIISEFMLKPCAALPARHDSPTAL